MVSATIAARPLRIELEVKSMKIPFTLKTDTKTCYRFEHGYRPELITLYLKKSMVDEAGIDPKKGIIVTVEQDK